MTERDTCTRARLFVVHKDVCGNNEFEEMSFIYLFFWFVFGLFEEMPLFIFFCVFMSHDR
jgi:hypothetical protein